MFYADKLEPFKRPDSRTGAEESCREPSKFEHDKTNAILIGKMQNDIYFFNECSFRQEEQALKFLRSVCRFGDFNMIMLVLILTSEIRHTVVQHFVGLA